MSSDIDTHVILPSYADNPPRTDCVSRMRFIARQPIFDRKLHTFGYELLFRSGVENIFTFTDGDQASKVVIDSIFLLGLDALTDSHKAFFNCTREILTQEFAYLLPKEKVVLEVLESVKMDEDVLRVCKELKAEGYQLALDDVEADSTRHPLSSFADFIKVDFIKTTPNERRVLARHFAQQDCTILAEKVETQDEFRSALEMGYDLCQGFFFAKPQMMSRREIPSFKANMLLILSEANKSELNLDGIAESMEREASVCFKLLKYLNSFAFAFRREIHSIRHGLALMGENEVRRWVSLVVTSAMAEDKPAELMISSLIRARCCDLLASSFRIESRRTDLFLAGLFSLMDAVLDLPMATILADVPLAQDCRKVLLSHSGVLWPPFEATVAMEKGDWEGLSRIARERNVKEDEIADAHMKALEWACQVFHLA
jgi:c-di-GMP-related signal transduction protein